MGLIIPDQSVFCLILHNHAYPGAELPEQIQCLVVLDHGFLDGVRHRGAARDRSPNQLSPSGEKPLDFVRPASIAVVVNRSL